MKNFFFFYMFYNNMYETSSKLNEILLLNRQLRNYLYERRVQDKIYLNLKN